MNNYTLIKEEELKRLLREDSNYRDDLRNLVRLLEDIREEQCEEIKILKKQNEEQSDMINKIINMCNEQSKQVDRLYGTIKDYVPVIATREHMINSPGRDKKFTDEDVIERINKKMTQKEIAAELGVQPSTVSVRIKHLREKGLID